MSLRAIVGDRDPFVRRAVDEALSAAGHRVIAEARTGREVVTLALQLQPDVVFVELVMPELDGILATQRILAADPGQRIVILAPDGDTELGWTALDAGAAAFLTKDVELAALSQALVAVRA